MKNENTLNCKKRVDHYSTKAIEPIIASYFILQFSLQQTTQVGPGWGQSGDAHQMERTLENITEIVSTLWLTKSIYTTRQWKTKLENLTSC